MSGLQPHNSSIVLVGSFRPPTFQPRWFADHKLIRASEAGLAQIDVIHPSLVAFTTKWFNIRVEEQRFQIMTEQEPMYELMRDLGAGTLSRLDDSSPRALGLNWVFTYEPSSVEAAHDLGHRLVRKDDWNELLENPGTLAVTIESQRRDDFAGYLQTRVQLINRAPFSILIEINDHYDLTVDDENSSFR